MEPRPPEPSNPEQGTPSFGMLVAVGVVAGLVVGVTTTIASLSPGLGVLLGTIVGVLSMLFASERLSLFKRRPRR